MFQFPSFPSLDYGFIKRSMILHQSGFPIRKSADRSLFAAPRSLSQLVTSFVGSWCQGIHLVLFHAWTSLFFLLSIAWVSQIIILQWKSFLFRCFCFGFSACSFEQCGQIVVLPRFSERPSIKILISIFSLILLIICSFLLFSFQWTFFLIATFACESLTVNFVDSGGLKWSRTTDLMLIRHAL